MKTIVYDCDNTMGIPQRDIDDGLTILYLMGNRSVEFRGITTTFGNDDIDPVFAATRGLLKDFDREDIPLFKGGSPGNRKSRASEFLVETVNAAPGEITLLATGALTNLYGAHLLDGRFFETVKEVVVMGGLTHPLVIGGENMDELNFSCDPEATYAVLQSPAKTTVITGNLCLGAFFGPPEMNRLKNPGRIRIYDYILARVNPWVEFMGEVFTLDGFYNWDMAAAVYTTNPDLFLPQSVTVNSAVEDLASGHLKIAGKEQTVYSSGYPLNIPTTIRDISRFNDIVFDAWENVRDVKNQETEEQFP